MSFARSERAAIVQTCRGVGPDGPTLCAGWAVVDLVAHMVIRERRLDAAPGIVIGALAGYTESVQRRTAYRPWDELLDLLSSGPPWYSPLRPLDSLVNGAEMFIHHEDVRRAQPDWTARTLAAGDMTTLRRPIRMMAGRTMGSTGRRIVLVDQDGVELAAVGSGPTVTVRGEVGEVLLFVFGRDHVRLDFFADDENDIVAVKSADRSA